MFKVNIHEAKAHFSQYLAKIEAGETMLICKRNIPIAELRPLPSHSKERRPIGLAKNTFSIPEAFFEPLPEEFMSFFNTHKI